MVDKDILEGEVLAEVTVYTLPAGTATVPTQYIADPEGATTPWKAWGLMKEVPAFSQPINSNTIEYADQNADRIINSRQPVTMRIPAGQIVDEAEDIFFSGSDSDDLPRRDLLVDYAFTDGQPGRQLFLPDALAGNFDDYQPSRSDGSIAGTTFSSGKNARLGGRSFRHLRQAD